MLTALFFSAAAAAQDLARLTGVCAACHGADGNSPVRGTPSLAGQPRIFLENQLVLIRDGVREIPAMLGMLKGLPDRDLTALAKHYAALPAKPVGGDTMMSAVLYGVPDADIRAMAHFLAHTK